MPLENTLKKDMLEDLRNGTGRIHTGRKSEKRAALVRKLSLSRLIDPANLSGEDVSISAFPSPQWQPAGQ